MTTTNTQPAPGWFPDPENPAQLRYWNGTAWTGQVAPSVAPQRRGLAIAALIVGIAAFLSGWVPVLGATLGVTAVALAVAALVKGQPRGLAVTAVVLGVVAAITSVVVTIVLSAGGLPSRGDADPSGAATSADTSEARDPSVIRVGEDFTVSGASATVTAVAGDVACSNDLWEASYGTLVRVSVDIDATARRGIGILLDWKVIAADGTTTNDGGRSSAAIMCLESSDALPGYIESGNRYTGDVVLEVPPGAQAILLNDMRLPLDGVIAE